MNSFGNFFREKTLVFRATMIVGAVTLCTSVVYICGTAGVLLPYRSLTCFLLLLLSPFVAAAVALLGKERIGAIILALANVAALAFFVVRISDFAREHLFGAGTEGLPIVIVCATLMLVCVNAAVIIALIPQDKKEKDAGS